MMKEKSRQVTVRRIAKRRGYTASLSRLRDKLAVGYGMWTVTEDRLGHRRVSPPGGWTLDQVEQWLADMERKHDQGN
jgi:hypothetical protein